MVHGLTVRVVLRDAAAFPIFLRAFEDLYAYSRTCEPDTLTYELHKATDSDDADADRTWLILERYTAKADLTEVHNKSAFLQKFGAWVGENIGAAPNAQGERPVLESIKLEHWTEVTIESSTAPSTEKPPKSPKVVPAKASDGNTAAVSPNRGQEEQGNGVLVFAGARAGDSPAYMRDAEILGRIVGRSGRPLVYGAGTVGVMGAVAQAAREVGGEVISVIPYALAPREVAGDVQTDAIVVDTMSERKAVMFAKSNWTIALPGGIGTLDELFEVLTLSQLNAYKSKVGILNTDNFYGPLLAMLEHLVQAKFLDKHTVEQLVVRSDPQQLWEALGSAPDPVPAANLVWPRAF